MTSAQYLQPVDDEIQTPDPRAFRDPREKIRDIIARYHRGELVDEVPTVTLHGVGILYPGEHNMIFGGPGAGKTTICLRVAAEALRSGLKIVWVYGEGNAERIVKRILKLVDVAAVAENMIVIPKDDKATYYAFAQRPDTLVVLDSISSMVDGDYNNNETANRYLDAYVRPATIAGATVLSIGHVPKSADGAESTIGSQVFHSDIQGACYSLTKVKEDEDDLGDRVLKCVKDNNPIDTDRVGLKWQVGTDCLAPMTRGRPANEKVHQNQRIQTAIDDLTAELGEKPSERQISDRAEVSRYAVRSYLKDLEQAGIKADANGAQETAR